jgi:hypothetical protein
MDKYEGMIEKLSKNNDINIISNGDRRCAIIFVLEALRRQRCSDTMIFSRFNADCVYLDESIIFQLKCLLCDGKNISILMKSEQEVEFVAKYFQYEISHNYNIKLKKISSKFDHIEYGFLVTGDSFRFEPEPKNTNSSFASFNGEVISNTLKEKFNLFWNTI